MRRLSRREVCARLHLSERRVQELCREGYFPSARRDAPRGGWTLAACCVESEEEGCWPCAVCVPLRAEVESEE